MAAITQSLLRKPQSWLVIGGVSIPCISASVTRKSKRSSDTFSAVLSTSIAASYGYDKARWAALDSAEASLVMSDGATTQTMVSGEIKQPTLDWFAHRVTVDSQDKSTKLGHTRRVQKFPNQKSSDIASQIAQANGLNPVVVATGDNAGKIYQQDYAHLVLNRTDYETLSDLAQREGYEWFVDGSDLVFQPLSQGSDPYLATLIDPPSPGSGYQVGTITSLTTSRNMVAAKKHTVKVKSWHHKDAKIYTGQAQSGGIDDGDPIERIYHHNGYNQGQVDKLAKSRLATAKRHEMSCSLTMPGDLTLDVRQKLQLAGTGTTFDQTYDIDSITFRMGFGEAFLMDLDCKGPKGGS